MEKDLAISRCKSFSLLKKNEKFNWMNHYYFNKNGDVYFGNLNFLVRLVNFHDSKESFTINLNGEIVDDIDGVNIQRLFDQGASTVAKIKPLLSCITPVEENFKKFKIVDKITEKNEMVMLYVDRATTSLNYLSPDESVRMKVKLDWELSDEQGLYCTFLNSKIILSLLKLFEDDQVMKWVFFEDKLPILMVSKNIQVICMYGKDVPYYFEEYTKRGNIKRKKEST